MDLATPSTLQPRAPDTRGSRCPWTVLVRHRGCADARVPASADAETKPGGLCQSREEKAPKWRHLPPLTLDPPRAAVPGWTPRLR